MEWIDKILQLVKGVGLILVGVGVIYFWKRFQFLERENFEDKKKIVEDEVNNMPLSDLVKRNNERFDDGGSNSHKG